MGKRLGFNRRGCPFFNQFGQVGAVEAIQVDVLELDQLGNLGTKITVDQQNTRGPVCFMQVANNVDQGIQLVDCGPGQLVDDQQPTAPIKLLQDANPPAIFTGAG